jgi:Leucine-rich repeat (LRR) protein
MAYQTRTFYGYKVSNNFSDVIDPRLALERLKLNIGDLDIIRGAVEAGAAREDLIAVSGLEKEVYKTLDRYIGETGVYQGILNQTGGVDSPLFGNLNVNGPLAASAIRYNFLNNDSDTIGIADISTSRVSAWSTASSTPSESDPIFYGGQVKISTNSGGVGGTIIANKLTWGEIAQPKIFAAELPTHKITVNINGNSVKLYAMKSIPLKFTAFIRNFNGAVTVTPIPNTPVGWRIINLTNAADEQRVQTNNLFYRSVTAAPRLIEIYYPPNNFTSITLPSVGISELPLAELPNLTSLNISFNQFKNIPNLNTFSPSLETLNIFGNNLYLATDPSLRNLNTAAINRLPISIRSINAYGTYFGSIRCVDRSVQTGSGTIIGNEITTGIGGPNSMSVIEARFPNLITLNVQRGSGPAFGPDNYDNFAYLPSVSNTCENYFAANNDFRRVPDIGLKNLTNLRNFNVYGNYSLTDNSFSLDSFQLTSIDIGNTLLPIPDLSGRTLLTTFNCNYNRNTNTLFTSTTDPSYKFSNCSALTTFNFYGASISGFIPKFKGNFNLQSIDLYAAQRITGGRPNNGEHGYADGTTFVMYKDTFNDAKGIRFFRVLSNSLLIGKGFEPDTFKNLSSLDYLYWYSYRRTGSGAVVTIPDISSCPALRYMIMPVNNFSGSVPSFSSNDIIFYVDLSNNILTGPVPTFTNKTRLAYVFLNNNQLSSFAGFENTPSLIFVYLQNNNINTAIPMLSGQTPALQRLYLFNNSFSSYTVGSFANVTRIQIIDISNNNLTETDLNNIVDDLYLNYISAPRRGVNVNLRGQARAVGYNPSALGSEREQQIREKIDFLRTRGWTISIGG